jgi:hypothetical protein
VGEHFKSPRLPVWVVCAESHYSVLFRPPAGYSGGTAGAGGEPSARELMRTVTAAAEGGGGGMVSGKFDLFHWDGLAGQDEPIRLTLDPAPATPPPSAEDVDKDSLIPPVDLVLRTKWGNVGVDWNGVEPWL